MAFFTRRTNYKQFDVIITEAKLDQVQQIQEKMSPFSNKAVTAEATNYV